jgi:hypothetical protein
MAAMRDPARERGVLVASLVLLSALAVGLLLATTGTGDYLRAPAGTPGLTDDAAPGIAALLHGDLGAFLRDQPALGLTSILLRLPAAALSRLLGFGLLGEYRAGAVVCLAAAVVFGALVARAMLRRGTSSLTSVTVGALAVANPLTLAALRAGHAEEILCAALCAGSVWAAERRRPGAAALLIGLALGTKPWAILALPVVALALEPGTRLRAGVRAGVVAAALVLPAPVLAPAAYRAASRSVTNGAFVSPRSLWWPVSPVRVRAIPAGTGQVRYAVLPGGLDRQDAWLLLLAGAVLACLTLRRRAFAADDALRLLAVIMLARVLVDPFVMSYYALPLVLTLLVLAVRRPATGILAAGVVLGAHVAELPHPPGVAFALTLAWALPVAVVLLRGSAGARAEMPIVSPARVRLP